MSLRGLQPRPSEAVVDIYRTTMILNMLRKECDMQLTMARGEGRSKVYLMTEELKGMEIK